MTRTVRDVHTHQSALARYRAERLLRNGFPQLRAKVLAVVRSRLRAQGVALDPGDLDGCYAQAWHGLYARTLAGERVQNPAAWLVVATTRRAIDEARASASAAAKADAVAAIDAGRAERDLAGELDDRDRLRELFEALRSRLSARECEAASLCYLHGLTRAQAAARMGLSEARMRKLMEGRGAGEPGVAAKVGDLVATIRAGGWCEQQSSLLRAYAFGMLDPDGERHALAVAHTRECPACRAQVALMRGLAVVLPPLPLLAPLGRAHRAPAGRVRLLARRGASLVRRLATRGGERPGAGLSLPAKLALTGALLIGAGAAYFVARPATSPARASAVRGAAASRTAPPVSGPRTSPLHERGRRRPVRASHRQVRSARHARSHAPAAVAAPTSASEFSPERVRGEAPSSPPTTPAPPPARSGGGEFGIEPGG
jgi:DNA-directed RNA polymerase specialized sigma24 family protein